MIVDLERNDLARVAETGTVEVESLYDVTAWSGCGTPAPGGGAAHSRTPTTLDVLAALLPGGSVTGAPKQAAWQLLAELEPVGRGPAMGALGLLWPGGMDLGLTIRTVGVDDDRVHLWAGGGHHLGERPRPTRWPRAHARRGPSWPR
jgi:para-aminobenzoate synthetase component 1